MSLPTLLHLSFDFINITPDNHSQVKTVNLKVLLFIITSSTILIEYNIFNFEKETIKVTISKL